LIDIATLTGACVVAVGHRISAVMTNTPKLYQNLRAQGVRAGEKFWELPLEKEYQPDIKSKIADLQNIGKRRGEAGTIIGGLFLQEFVDGLPWGACGYRRRLLDRQRPALLPHWRNRPPGSDVTTLHRGALTWN